MHRLPRLSRLGVVTLSVALGTLTLVTSPSVASEPRVVVASAAPLPAKDPVVPVAASTSFDVQLTQRHASSLPGFIASLYDTASPEYHHFLTPSSYAKTFGASADTIAAVRAYLQRYGLVHETLSASHVLLHVTGATSAIARAFDAPLETVRTASGSLATQFASPASLPRSIASDVQSVAGLSSVTSPRAALATSHASSHVAIATSCSSAGSAGTTPNSLGGYPATVQAQLYGLTGEYATGDTGVGQTIAAYELGLYDQADVATYFACYGLSPSLTSINVDGGPTGGYSEEATIDVEEAAALAPGAAIEIYQGPNDGSSPIDVYQQIADDDTATIVTTSWGICETDPSGSVDAEQPIFEQMAAQGQTVVAAAGDSGSSDCADNPDGYTPTTLAVDDPASQPLVTGVGGLSVTSTSPLVESVWNDGVNGGAGGGGKSAVWSRPAWQIAPGITSSETTRMVPDLSTMADPNTGFIEYYTGTATGTVRCRQVCSAGWSAIGGTSIGAPLVSALVAVAAQVCASPRLGFINPQLYAMASEGVGFTDVTTGNNDLYNAGGYSAGVGYDMASGLGSPDGAPFFTGLCPAKLDAAKSTFSAPSASVATGSAASLSATLFAASGSPLANAQIGVSATAASGTLEINADPASATGTGQASETLTTNSSGTAAFTLTDTTAGPVMVTITYEGTTVHTATVTFSAAHVAGSVPGQPKIASLVALVGGFKLVVAPDSAGSSPITSFQYSLNGGAAWTNFSAVTRSVSVGSLPKSHTYAIVVRARNAVGVSAVSAPSRVTTRP
ncbi:MAG: protease pro-enzyme activation domain-containing protein [Acidimicrobiales bacterium]